ncbi:S-layer protein [Streptococcus suis]|uniref:TnsA endonuclease N-terminal domain-containing protein n=1 Tax=Streptococcus suis TaxID=1307 RepID=A0A0Z8IM85_STRSU|nr:TnsA endonuclease N-terminal domain-containing protein [Streptococcus suis]MBM7153720.1 Tn7 transposase TnsA N-terminal domain-containing protein [Streptococcus suis]MCR1232302.1 TnsA endonuclease N-terminal domain-containing protein [Streptococcus suis]MDG4503515.1 TnsA endonuclease N-terminal domain-containing protein [Streptococcus suis]NQG64702.1 S-layer protein [Streptococcus suis]NQG66814.1 S-layer protein [Streptococcus suis]
MKDIKPIHHNFLASRKYGNNRMIVYSPKLKRKVVLFSNLEYYCYLFLEFDTNVVDFCEQPDIGIKHLYDGKIHSSVADFLVEYKKDTLQIVECKPSSELNNTKVIKQLQIQKEWAIANKISHRIFTEKEVLKKQCSLSNLKRLHTALLQVENLIEPNTCLINSILKVVSEHSVMTINQILSYKMDGISNRNILSMLSYLFHQGKLEIDIHNSLLNQESVVKML